MIVRNDWNVVGQVFHVGKVVFRILMFRRTQAQEGIWLGFRIGLCCVQNIRNSILSAIGISLFQAHFNI